MARIAITDLPGDMKVSDDEMQRVMGGRRGRGSFAGAKLSFARWAYVRGPSLGSARPVPPVPPEPPPEPPDPPDPDDVR